MAGLKLQIGLVAADKISKPFDRARRSTGRLRSAMSEATSKVRDLERTAADLDAFRRLKSTARANAKALSEAQAKVDRLAGEMASADTVTRKMRAEFAAAKKEATRLRTAMDADAAATHDLRGKLRAAGVDTRKLAGEQRRLKGNLDAARQAADRQGEALDRARRKTQAFARARAKMDKTLGRQANVSFVGAAGVAAGGSALAVGSRMAGSGINFGEQMSAVGALARLDKTSQAFQSLKAQAQELGATTSFSASEAAGGMRYLAMAGFDAAEIMSAMPGMLDLAKAGGADLATTADIASNIMSGFRLEADQMGRVGDVLAATFTRSNVDLNMLGDTMKYVAPIASELGTSVEEAASMAGLLGNIGIQGSEAGTALRALHTRMASPPPKAETAFDQLGVSTRTASGDLRAMTDILADVATATEDMGSAERVAAFTAIAGQEAGAAMAALVGDSGAGAITQFTDILGNATGEAGRIAREMGDNAAGDIDSLASAVEGMNIALTETNTSPLRDLVQSATSVVRATTAWIKENPELAGGLVKVAAIAAGLVLTGGALATAIAGILGPFAMARFALSAVGIQAGSVAHGLSFITRGAGLLSRAAKIAFPVVAGGIRAISAAMMANPIGLIIGGIALAAGLLITFWEPISGFFARLWGNVGGYFTRAWDLIKTAFSFTPLGLLINNWEPIAGFFSGLWEGITSVFTGAYDFIIGKLKALKAPLDWVADKVGGLFGDDEDSAPAEPARKVPPPRPVRTRAVAATAAAVAASGMPLSQAAAAMPPPPQQTIQITVNAAPGMDERQLAAEVRRQLEDMQSRDRAATRNRLHDGMD